MLADSEKLDNREEKPGETEARRMKGGNWDRSRVQGYTGRGT
jgi:hypothetical protein